MRPILFVSCTFILVFVSRKSLLRPRSHGFFRFFAWETILGLFLLNVPVWFHDPLAWHQVVSWVLLIVCIIPFVLGIVWLRTRGRPTAGARRGAELLAFERTTKLVNDGIFGLIRHPLYSSLLLLAWGVFFKDPSSLGIALALAATILLLLTAKRDEAECLQTFGAAYREYMHHTRMFIPYVL